MNNPVFPDGSTGRKSWSPEGVVEQKQESRNSLVQWWYDLTAIPEAEPGASFFRREAARKSRLLSNGLFFFTICIAVFLPCCLFLQNKLVVWCDAAVLVACIISLFVNRTGNTLFAGLITVVTFDIALTVALFTTTPLDETNIQLYDLYIMTELLVVSLLPIRSIFIVAAINCGIIIASLLYQPHTAVLDNALQTQFIPVMIRPVALQFIVAGTVYMWVFSMTKAVERADRAEMVAKLEHALVDQKRELEEGIGQILQTHVAVANGNLNARAPLTQDNALWQIARALNTLLVRLQRASQAERELQRVEQAVTAAVRAIQQAEQQQHMPRITFTQTVLDPLIVALQGKTISYTQAPFAQQHNTHVSHPTYQRQMSPNKPPLSNGTEPNPVSLQGKRS